MVIEQYLTVTVGTLKRAGLFAPNARRKVKIEWDRGDTYASITTVSDFTGAVPCVVFSYYHRGRPVEQGVTLRYRPLYNGGGVYYFICPVSGLSCEKLLFSEEHGQFVGRVATGAPYLNHVRKGLREHIRARPFRWSLRNPQQTAVTC